MGKKCKKASSNTNKVSAATRKIIPAPAAHLAHSRLPRPSFPQVKTCFMNILRNKLKLPKNGYVTMLDAEAKALEVRGSKASQLPIQYPIAARTRALAPAAPAHLAFVLPQLGLGNCAQAQHRATLASVSRGD